MSHYIKSGNRFDVLDRDAITSFATLPPTSYVVKEDPRKDEFYLEQMEGFTSPSKVYGDTLKNADRIMSTFSVRQNSTGVLLTGEKGSGKTLLARILGNRMNEQGYPVIMVTSTPKIEGLNKFLDTIREPAMVFFDEFEKIYNRHGEQHKLLSLLDGVYMNKKLFVLTCNDKNNIDSHMKNRPGRIFYSIEYTGLEADFIREYCTDTLKDQSQIDSVCKIAALFTEFNFDLLKAVVEEMNRYNESAEVAIKLLNASPDGSEAETYNYVLFFKGIKVPYTEIKDDMGSRMGNTIWCNPLSGIGDIAHEVDGSLIELSFKTTNLVSIDPVSGEFFFRNGEYEIKLVRRMRETFNYKRFME